MGLSSSARAHTHFQIQLGILAVMAVDGFISVRTHQPCLVWSNGTAECFLSGCGWFGSVCMNAALGRGPLLLLRFTVLYPLLPQDGGRDRDYNSGILCTECWGGEVCGGVNHWSDVVTGRLQTKTLSCYLLFILVCI